MEDPVRAHVGKLMKDSSFVSAFSANCVMSNVITSRLAWNGREASIKRAMAASM